MEDGKNKNHFLILKTLSNINSLLILKHISLKSSFKTLQLSLYY